MSKRVEIEIADDVMPDGWEPVAIISAPGGDEWIAKDGRMRFIAVCVLKRTPLPSNLGAVIGENTSRRIEIITKPESSQVAPWTDRNDHKIKEGDTLTHVDGLSGEVVVLDDKEDKWNVRVSEFATLWPLVRFLGAPGGAKVFEGVEIGENS